MLTGWHPVWQAAFGTLFTWSLTAAGSGLVFIFSSGQVRNILGKIDGPSTSYNVIIPIQMLQQILNKPIHTCIHVYIEPVIDID